MNRLSVPPPPRPATTVAKREPVQHPMTMTLHIVLTVLGAGLGFVALAWWWASREDAHPDVIGPLVTGCVAAYFWLLAAILYTGRR